jgi:hypothetical protein
MSEIVVIIRPSFMKFCEDGCRAALFNHILYWIAKKAKGQTQEKIQSAEITYYATNEELIECLAGAWGREKVRMETNNLIEMGLIGRGKNLKYGADRTKHFHFGKEQCEKLFELCQQHKICLACIGLSEEIVHLLKTVKQNPNTGNAKPESGFCFECPEHEHYWNSGKAKPESGQALTKITAKTSKTKGTDKEASAVQENPTQSQSDTLSLSPSQNKSIEDWLMHFDGLYQKKSGVSNYRYSRKDTKINDAILKLIETGATFEQVGFVFNDIWDDKDAFWQEHKGKIWVVESQFATRVAKMNQLTPGRRTASGFTNWTEDKTIGMTPTIPSTPKATEKPKEPALPIGYTRLKIEKPARPRSLQARIQQEQKGL